MRTPEELDRMHEDVVRRFPDGLTPDQFRLVTLESVDEDGKIYPHSIADVLQQFRMLLHMGVIDGLIENRGGGYNRPFDWHITQKGRDWLGARQAA